VAGDANVNVCVSNHPNGVVDAEVTWIASENTADPDSPVAMQAVPGA
jgi:hypothetical protein